MILMTVLIMLLWFVMTQEGWASVFHMAAATFAHTPKPADGLLPAPAAQLSYATLTLGSALVIFLYPHTMTGALAAKDRATVKRTLAVMPLYSLMLGIFALLGFAAIAASVKPFGRDQAGGHRGDPAGHAAVRDRPAADGRRDHPTGFPAVALGLFTRWFHRRALIAGAPGHARDARTRAGAAAIAAGPGEMTGPADHSILIGHAQGHLTPKDLLPHQLQSYEVILSPAIRPFTITLCVCRARRAHDRCATLPAAEWRGGPRDQLFHYGAS